MSIFENAALVLRTSDLTANSTNAVGTCDQYRTNFTWNNINLRALLGSMYDKYDKFNISLNAMSTALILVEAGTDPDDGIVQLYMGGLPFINQTYDVVRGGNTGNCVISIFAFPLVANTYEIQYFNSGSNQATFDKSQDLVNINLFYQRVKKSAGAAGTYICNPGGVSYPDMIFMFDIYGIPKEHTIYREKLQTQPNVFNF